MKYLLILLMLCGVLFAENEFLDYPETQSTLELEFGTTHNLISDIYRYNYTFGSGDSIAISAYGEKYETTENMYAFIGIIRLLQIYDEYEQECYADSSWFPFITWLDDCSYRKPHWEHREPTFQGYIEFLKEKVK